MSKYDLRNSQIGAVGDGTVANNTVFNIGKMERKEIDLDALEIELSDFKKYIELKNNKSKEEYRLLADATEIEEFLEKKDLTGINNKIKECASNLFYTMASGIGSGILANLISKALGI